MGMAARVAELRSCCLTALLEVLRRPTPLQRRRVDFLPGPFWPFSTAGMWPTACRLAGIVAGLQRGVLIYLGISFPRLRARSGDWPAAAAS